jgi:thiol-disulfide isomerase/thioredoxin
MAFTQNMNQKIPDPKHNNEMLIGYCNRDGFKLVNCNFDSAYNAEYLLYHPDKETINLVSGKLKDVKVTLVMATWCGDSKEWVPRFYKIMDGVDFNYQKLTLICVNHSKEAAGTNVKDLKVTLVPTFIFYRNDAEIGRIIEVPSDLMEKEMLKILMN